MLSKVSIYTLGTVFLGEVGGNNPFKAVDKIRHFSTKKKNSRSDFAYGSAPTVPSVYFTTLLNT